MRYVCSYCHTGFEAEPSPHMVCPTCKAEAGIERFVAEPPKPMQMFGVFLLVTAILAPSAGLCWSGLLIIDVGERRG